MSFLKLRSLNFKNIFVFGIMSAISKKQMFY